MARSFALLAKGKPSAIQSAYGWTAFQTKADARAENKNTHRDQIIPLLQEYFYNDWEGLRYVLGENSKSDGSFIRKLNGADDREARTKWHWYFDASVDSLNCLQTLGNNYKTQLA
jgi:hypothetical protein